MKPNPVSLVPTELACSHMFHMLGEAVTLLLPPNPNPGVIQGGGAARGRHQRRGWLGGCNAALCAVRQLTGAGTVSTNAGRDGIFGIHFYFR